MAFDHSSANRQKYGLHSLMKVMLEVKDSESVCRAGIYFLLEAKN
jgi:hypothetical protein